MASGYASIQKANGDLAVASHNQTIGQVARPFRLLSIGPFHEKRWSVLGSTKLGNCVRIDEELSHGDFIGIRKSNFSVRESQ